MDDKLFTITEAANELNVTRQCVYKKLTVLRKDLKPYIVVKNSQKFLTTDGIELINENLNSSNNNKKNDKAINEVNSKDVLKDEIKHITELKIMYEDRIKELKEENENRIKDLKEEIDNLRDESREKNKLISSIQRESESKNDLLKNMQILIKEKEENSKKILLNKKRTRWWQFKK
jgi:chromosome segregation ATPase